MSTISLAGSYQLNEKWSLRIGLALIQDGTLKPVNALPFTVKPGGVISAGLEYFHQRGTGYRPSLDYSVFLSASSTTIESPLVQTQTSYFSTDFRLGARATWTIKEQVFPFVAGRVFAGPVSWELQGEDVLGSDIHHYQFALGTAIQFGSLGTFVEWAGLGEKALSMGLSYTL